MYEVFIVRLKSLYGWHFFTNISIKIATDNLKIANLFFYVSNYETKVNLACPVTATL